MRFAIKLFKCRVILKDHKNSNAKASFVATWINLVMWNALDKSWFDLFFSFIYFIKLKIGHFWWSNIWNSVLKFWLWGHILVFQNNFELFNGHHLETTLQTIKKTFENIFQEYLWSLYPEVILKKGFSRWKSRSLESWSLLWRVLEVFYGSENIQIKPKLWIEHQKYQKLFLDVLLTKILIHNRFRVCLSLEMILNS